MAKPTAYVRWTEEEEQLLRESYPHTHEAELWVALQRRFTIIAIRNKAIRMGLKKAKERYERLPYTDMANQLAAAKERIAELTTVQKLLKDRIGELEKQLITLSRRAHPRA